MIHLSILTLIFAFAAGAVAITISALSYRQSRSAHIVPHIYLIGSVNLIIIINISNLYFYQNLSSDASVATVLMVDRAYQILMPAFQIMAVCSLRNLGLMLIGLLCTFRPRRLLNAAGVFHLLGILLFCGSLYVLALSAHTLAESARHSLGLTAACGGTSFIVGWFLLAASVCCGGGGSSR